MKKVLIFLLIVSLLIVSCSKKETPNQQNQEQNQQGSQVSGQQTNEQIDQEVNEVTTELQTPEDVEIGEMI